MRFFGLDKLKDIKIMNKIINYLKKDAVLIISALFMVVSAFFVPPSSEYIKYIDFRTLCLLLSLMIVVEGLKAAGFLEYILNGMLKYVKTTRTLVYICVLLCFFSSMLITNDVALITFVPAAIMLLLKTGNKKLMIPVIVLQTVAANLGSMLTPIGNPQNLYLYSLAGMSMAEFVKITLPPTVMSLGVIIISVLFIKSAPIASETENVRLNMKNTLLWVLMFMLSVLSVLRIVLFWVLLAVVVCVAVVSNKKLILKADFGLLLTFVFFFVFVGNMQRIPQISDFLTKLTYGRECDTGILLSQIMSNVPAAILLSGFTDNYGKLITGVNLGGLGTIIASMASLISYKLYCGQKEAEKGKFMAVFTVVNVVFLIILRIGVIFL